MLVLTHSPGFAPNFAPADAAAASRHARQAAEFSKGRIALLFAVLLAIASVPILLNPLPPISDYINHLARMYIIATGNSDPYLHRYYEINWQIIPNLMMDMVVPLFERVMNVYLAGQTYTLLSFALIISGALALHRTLFGRWSALPLIAFPLLYNDMFLVGTMNFVFGIGLMLWALAAWVALRERNRVLRLAVSALFVLGLFFCHLFVLGDYAVGLLAFESHRLCVTYIRMRRASGRIAARRALPGLMLDYVLTGSPFLPVLALLMISPTRGLWDYVWSLEGKGDGALAAIGPIRMCWLTCSQASLRRRPHWRCAIARFRSTVSAGCCFPSACSRIWRCRRSSSKPIWRISGCRSRSPSCWWRASMSIFATVSCASVLRQRSF